VLVRRQGHGKAALLQRAAELGVEQLYRQEMRDAYLRAEITREQAIEELGIEEVDDLDYARQAVLADVEWGLRGD